MKIYAAFLLILLLVLQYKFWFDKGGYIYNIQLEKQLQEMEAENERLKARNLELARKIILVKEDPNEIEHLARKNLGMIKEDEKFMFIIDEGDKGPNKKTAKKPNKEPDKKPQRVTASMPKPKQVTQSRLRLETAAQPPMESSIQPITGPIPESIPQSQSPADKNSGVISRE